MLFKGQYLKHLFLNNNNTALLTKFSIVQYNTYSAYVYCSFGQYQVYCPLKDEKAAIQIISILTKLWAHKIFIFKGVAMSLYNHK